ncbi:MAG TPA: hypothetical protein DCY13_16690 [Verrucomicrobiales bacterium]|nr:hypothetical protein [Verrucomicrobiales bacterium]
MNSSRINWILGFLAAVVAVAWGIYRFKPVPPPPAPVIASEPEVDDSMRPDRQDYVQPDDPVLMAKVFDLENEVALLDRKHWQGEMLSHRYGDVFVKLWDKLRHAREPLKVLQSFPVGQMVLGADHSVSHHEWDIRVTTSTNAAAPLNQDQWNSRLQKWHDDGYRLDASEWRHARFDPPTELNPARSTMFITLHVEQPGRGERHTVRGDLLVTWQEPASGEGEPVPSRIDASNLTVTSRTGPPMFAPLESRVVMPFTNTIFIEPLMAYDLNGDGLSELILGCRNQVYWNKGDGDFELGTLCRYRPERPFAMTIGDFDGDGFADLLSADVVGVELYVGNALGQFNEPGRPAWTAPAEMGNPYVFASGDIDKDGDLDVWLAQYKVPYSAGQMPTPYYDANDGFPGYLLLNDGRGNFTDATEGSGLAPKRFRRAYSSSFVDLDEDGDLDFVIVSDFAGVDVYLNDGKGRFNDITPTHVDEPHSLGMGHTFGDYDLDGNLDFYVIGMISYAAQRMDHLGEGRPEFPLHQKMRPIATYGSRLYLARDGRYVHTPMSDQVARTGWSWGVATGDFDNNGTPDLHVNNGQLSRATAKDYETEFWRHDIYLADAEPDEPLGVYFSMKQTRLFGEGWSYGGYDFNRFYLNEGGRQFLETSYQLGLAHWRDLRSVLADDFDGDGRLDIAYAGFEPPPAMQSGYHISRNRWQNPGNWIGFRLREEGGGFSPIGVRLNLTLNDGRVLKRVLVTGDSYRSQSAPTAHFGIGRETAVKEAEVIWTNGTVKRIAAPAINQYHAVRGRK